MEGEDERQERLQTSACSEDGGKREIVHEQGDRPIHTRPGLKVCGRGIWIADVIAEELL